MSEDKTSPVREGGGVMVGPGADVKNKEEERGTGRRGQGRVRGKTEGGREEGGEGKVRGPKRRGGEGER